MKYNKLTYLILATGIFMTGCKKDLAIQNPNNPSPESVNSETGIISYASGGIYINGFKNVKYTDGVYGPFWSGAMGFHELMGDVVGADAANAYLNQVGCPEKVVFDDASVVTNPNSPNKQIALIRQANNNQQAGNNFLYYEWAYMYNLISSSNLLLAKVDGISFTGDAASKKAAIKAWAYWWKGFAYSHIGSIYYAGLIDDLYQGTNGNYVTKEAIITEANSNFDKAVTAANSAPSAAEFTDTWATIIPEFNQIGLGGAPSPAMLARSVSTMKARNLLVNKTTATMTAADWTAIITLTNAGITSTDNIFTIRTDARGDLFTATQFVMGKTQSSLPGSATYKLSERWVQEFKTGDKRKTQNCVQGTPYLGQADRGNAHFTRWALKDGGTGVAGTAIYANTGVGAYELHIAGDYEENQLMKAEALINSSQIDAGLTIIDAIRVSQGAGLAAVSGTGLSLAAAKEELRRERRIVCAFKGLSFYDARRWKVIDAIAQGGGRTGCVALKNTGAVSTNATIEYNYLDYWDVPANELTYNPAGAGSAPVVNPKQ